jgi:hypothetical protein
VSPSASAAGQQTPPGQQPSHGRIPVDERLAGNRQVRERAQHLGEREVRQRAVPEVEAVADQHRPAGFLGTAPQLGEDPGLADTGVSAEQDGPRAGVGPQPDQTGELVELGVPTDEWRGNGV